MKLTTINTLLQRPTLNSKALEPCLEAAQVMYRPGVGEIIA